VHQQQIAFRIHANDLEVPVSRPIDAVVAGSTASPMRVSGIRVAVRGGLAMDHRSVRPAAAAEVMSLHAAGETVAFRGRDDVDDVAFRKGRCFDDRSDGCVVEMPAEFANTSLRRSDAGMRKSTRVRSRDASGLDVAECQHRRFVAVGLDGLPLQHDARSDFDDGERQIPTVRREDTRHPDLPADDVLHRENSLSTPLDNGAWRTLLRLDRRACTRRLFDHNPRSISTCVPCVNRSVSPFLQVERMGGCTSPANDSGVARTGNPAERDRLLQAAADYVTRRRRLDLTLRPLAVALDRTPRTLLYHFGSKDALLGAIADEVQRRQLTMFDQWLRRSETYDLTTFLLATWRWFAAPRHEALIQLFLENVAIGLRERPRADRRLRATADGWNDSLRVLLERSHVEPERAESLSTLVHAVIRGLLLDLIATGDRSRIDRAFRSFVSAIEEPSRANVRDALGSCDRKSTM